MTIFHGTGTRNIPPRKESQICPLPPGERGIIELFSKKLKKRRRTVNIYVGNLSYEATDVTIREAFESFGEVTSAKVIKDKYSGESRGFGFVEMPAQSQAQTAIRSLNGKELLGKPISVNEARPRSDQGRTGGGRMAYSGGRNRY